MSVFYIPKILYYIFCIVCFIFIVHIFRYSMTKSCQTVSINSKTKYVFHPLCYSFLNVMRTMVLSSVYWHSLSPILILISCFTNSVITVKFSCFYSELYIYTTKWVNKKNLTFASCLSKVKTPSISDEPL